MKADRHGVMVVTAVALALLLPACAAPKPDKSIRTWSYVQTRLAPHWWHTLVDVAGARAKGVTGAQRQIAILDTGVLPGHEDLAQVLPGAATCGSNSADTTDVSGHGTQLAGIALGKDPGHATRGVAPAARLIPIKVSCGVASADALTKGVDRAIAQNAQIVLLALGGYPAGPPDVAAFLKDRIGKNSGILFVVASIWDGTAYPFPEWTRLDNTIVVAAMTLDDARDEVPFSKKAGDIWAPGRDVETADILVEPANPSLHVPYMMQGTSAASAVVAGCAALLTEKTGQAGAPLKAALIQAAEPKPGLGAANNRRLNCAKAIP